MVKLLAIIVTVIIFVIDIDRMLKSRNRKFSSINTELNFIVIIFYLTIAKILCYNSTELDYLKLY